MSLKKLIGLTTLIALVIYAFFSAQNSNAQSLVNGPGNVGPELAFFDRGGQEGVYNNVLVPNNFYGAVQTINNIYEDPYNPAPGTSATLRLVEIRPWTTEQDMITYAEKLNNFNGFPEGTIVIVGNELNNLDKEFPMTEASFNDEGDLRAAAEIYGKLYVAFGRAIRDHNKYRIAPAPPDLYNGNWDPVPWVDAFSDYLAANNGCAVTDALVANVFDVPSRVGLPNLQTHLYLNGMCGLAVHRFGGWGAWPASSVADQVKFYNETPLPPGVTQATTLIADNCGGNAGYALDKWLFYVDGRVFRPDGSEVDPETCAVTAGPPSVGPGTPAGGAPLPPGNPPLPLQPSVPIPYTPCNETRDPEFHSLRPYPASPCDREAKTIVQMCADQFTAREVFAVTEAEATSCVQISAFPRTMRCNFDIASTINVAIFPGLTRLPIAGNTELVPNSQTSEDLLSNATRMNEYASWYLNGVVGRAEDEGEPEDWLPYTNEFAQKISDAINFSGPLKKLLPIDVQNGIPNGFSDWLSHLSQTGLRQDQQLDARASVNNMANIRHNQIAVCATSAPIACYEGDGASADNPKRLLEIRDQIFGGVLNQYGGRYNNQFSFIPFSSTEDNLGRVTFGLVGYQGTISLTSLTPNLPQDYNRLSFPHMIEVNQLANTLQKTFSSLDFVEHDPSNPQIDGTVQWGNPPMDQYQTQLNSEHCTQTETRKNPGDLLYGVIDNAGAPNHNPYLNDGDISYTASFQCDFVYPEPTQECLNACLANPATCTSRCIGLPLTTTECFREVCTQDPPPCSRYIDFNMRVTSTTPLADNLWDKLVAGNYSVFKRIFPRVAEDAPLKNIRDIPAEDSIRYDASTESFSGGTLLGTGALAGNPANTTAGYLGKIYFPHLGSVHKYFLQGIQCALRPFGLCSDPEFSNTSGIAPSPETGGKCTAREDCRPEIWSGITSWPLPIHRAMQEAAEAYNMPVCVLSAIASIEGASMESLTNEEAQYLVSTSWNRNEESLIDAKFPGLYNKINCDANEASARGPMQITAGVWESNRLASRSNFPSVCNARDALFAAARFLVEQRLPAYGYPASSGWDETRKFCASGETYSGSCYLVSPTNDATIGAACRNLGANYCDFIANYCGRAFPDGAKTCFPLVNPHLSYPGDACFLPANRI